MSTSRPSSVNREDDPDEGKTVVPQQLALLVIGKTGNGKSSLCNTIVGVQQGVLGQDTFLTGRSMSSTTTQMKYLDVHTDDSVLRVVDTPDVTNLNWDEQQKQQEVQKWKAALQVFRNVVLLAIRCDVRYTAEEYAVYKEFLRQWGVNSVKSRLVVAFTFGDLHDGDIGEELKTVCPELKSVLRDAGGRYVVFNNEADVSAKQTAVKELLMKFEEAAQPQPCAWGRVQAALLGFAVLILVTVVGMIFAYLGKMDWDALGLFIAIAAADLVLIAVVMARIGVHGLEKKSDTVTRF